MATIGPIKRKELASSVSPEANRSKKPNQDSDKCKECKSIIHDDQECSIQCQWCQQWVHSKCYELNDEECKILCKSSTSLVFLCTSCADNLDEAFELFDDSKSNLSKQILKDNLPEKQTELEKKLSVVETTLCEIKEELTSQLSKCRELLSSPNNAVASKPPALIANTVYTAFNEEKEREEAAKLDYTQPWGIQL